MVTDTHCHITCDEMAEHLDEVLEQAKEADVDLMMIMCTSKEEYERALKLKDQDPERFKVAFGWFCSDAPKITEEDLDFLEQEAMSGRMDVLGEIGLDYHWDTSFKDLQKELFIHQLDIANKANLPVSIHMRDASRDTMDILEAHAKTPIIFHCFSGSTPIMEEALKMDSMISFAGPITYKNTRQGVANVKTCPIDRLLSETDSPYLSPVPYRGKPNQPAYVVSTAAKIAELKDTDPDAINAQIRKNFLSLFRDKTNSK